MKKQLLLIVLLLICVVPLSSFKSGNRSIHFKNVKQQTDIEYGDFSYGSHLYAVYGDASGNVTNVYYFDGTVLGAAVYSWSGTATKVQGAKPGTAHLTIYTSPTSYFNYDGELLYY